MSEPLIPLTREELFRQEEECRNKCVGIGYLLRANTDLSENDRIVLKQFREGYQALGKALNMALANLEHAEARIAFHAILSNAMAGRIDVPDEATPVEEAGEEAANDAV